tara:strand:+ start:50 stop:595 length:546 start_codon:yes stop_codon:yes gene_type:complete
MKKLRQKIYEALQSVDGKVNYRELGEIAGCTEKGARSAVDRLNKLHGVNIKITSNKGQRSIEMNSNVSYHKAVNETETRVTSVNRVMENASCELSALEIIKLASLDLTKENVVQTLSFISRDKLQPIRKNTIDGVIYYKYVKVTPAPKKREKVKHVDMVGLLFSGEVTKAVEHNRIIIGSV